MKVTFPRFSQQVRDRARAKVSLDPELGTWELGRAGRYCPNFRGKGGDGQSDACGRKGSVTPEATCVLIESPIVAKYLGQGPVGFFFLN